MYDLLITNARIVDGSGNPWFRADVAVKDGVSRASGGYLPPMALVPGSTMREGYNCQGSLVSSSSVAERPAISQSPYSCHAFARVL